jgi:hypothetical protein
VTSPILPSILKCAISGFHVFHEDAHRSLMKFFRLVFKVGITKMHFEPSPEISNHREAIYAVFTQQNMGQSLMDAIIQAISSRFPSSYVQEVAEVLDLCLQFNAELFSPLLQQSCQSLIPSTLSAYKDKFLVQMLSHQASTRSRISAVKELHRSCKALDP